jgi:hypothetical protein
MKISSNYFERLLFNVLPTPGIIVLISLFYSSYRIAIIASILIIVLWSIDSLIIYLKYKPKNLFITSDLIKIGENEISHNDVKSIGLLVDRRSKWSFTFTVIKLTNGTSFNVLPKRKFQFINSYTKTIDLLLKIQPRLKSKIVKEVEI